MRGENKCEECARSEYAADFHGALPAWTNNCPLQNIGGQTISQYQVFKSCRFGCSFNEQLTPGADLWTIRRGRRMIRSSLDSMVRTAKGEKSMSEFSRRSLLGGALVAAA